MQQLALATTLAVILLAGSAQAAPGPNPWVFKQPGAKDTIKIGAVLPLDGDRAQQGAALIAGIQLAVKDAAPKVLPGANIEVVPVNGKCTAAIAKPAAAKLVSANVVGIIGEVCSRASKALIEATAAKKVPVISPASTSPSLSTADNFFRTVPSDAFQGVALVNAIKAAGLHLRVAVVYEDDSYGAGLVGTFKPALSAVGGKVVADYKFEGTGKPQEALNRVKAAKPDAVLLIVNDIPFAANFLKLVKAADLETPVFGGDSLATPDLVYALGSGLGNPPGTDALANFAATSTNPGNAAFQKRLNQATKGAAFDPYAATAYDATVALLKAVGAAKPRNGAAVAAQLQKSKFEGVTGPVSFDASGDRLTFKGIYVLNRYDPATKVFVAKGF